MTASLIDLSSRSGGGGNPLAPFGQQFAGKRAEVSRLPQVVGITSTRKILSLLNGTQGQSERVVYLLFRRSQKLRTAQIARQEGPLFEVVFASHLSRPCQPLRSYQ